MSSNWIIKGKYFESCTCDLVCPCIFLKPPTKGFCEAFVGWGIEEGHYDDTDLSNLNVSVWLHAPGLLTDGGWDLALYIDSRASDAQKSALENIYGGKAGGHPAVIASLVGNVMGVHSAEISFNYGDKTKEMTVKGVGEARLKAVEGADGGDVVVTNNPLAVSPGFPTVIHESQNIEYHGYDKNWQHSGTVGLAAPFEYKP